MLRALVACAVVLAARVAVAAPAFTVEVTGKGRPVILIPGLGCPASVWKTTAEHLAKAYEVHVLSLAGFAGQPAIERAIPGAVKDDLIQYIKEHNLEKPVIVGHSMGGFVAFWLAEAAPTLVGPVVSVDSGPSYGGGDPDILPWAKKKRDTYKAMSAKTFESTIRDRYTPMWIDPKKHEAEIAAVVKSDRAAFADAFFELYTVDLSRGLGKISVPVLAILADNPTVKIVREQMKPVKTADIVVLPTRHFVMHDDFAGFTKALDAFLAAHP